MIVASWLQRAAAARPHEPALVGQEGECWSYERLLGLARAAASELAARGAAPGERVAIALPPGLEFALALHACMLLGAVAVPLDLRLGERERTALAAGCSVEVSEPLSHAAPSRRGRSAPNASARGAGTHTHDLGAPALLIHTSGSTAAPKPVELTYGNLLWSALGSAVAIGLERRERWLSAMPLSHIGGLSILVRSAIYGTCAIVHERFETERVLDALQRERITTVSLVATTLRRLLDAGLENPPALRCALTGGGPVGAPLLQRALDAGIPVCLTYGLSEACSQVTTTPVADLAAQLEHGRPAAGPPLFCTRVRLAGDGEILVSGPTLAHAARAADGWLHTGDLGSVDARGRLSVSGRKADTIVTGGENVAPVEVESVLESHPLVLEAGVFALCDERWGERVCALVVAGTEGAQPAAAELREHCARLLAPYKVPKLIELTAEPLPRTASGKLIRGALAARAHQAQDGRAA